MIDNPVLRIVAKIIIPMILLFALYVQFHGDFGPGAIQLLPQVRQALRAAQLATTPRTLHPLRIPTPKRRTHIIIHFHQRHIRGVTP